MSHKALHATACKGCRRRGRKCDRTLPTCMSCERRGVVCEYVTRWPGVAARGKLAGKSIPVIDSSAIASSGTNSAKARQEENDDLEGLVKHYIEDLSSIFYLGDGNSQNPMFHYVLPLVDSVPSIRYAIAASASCHIAARTSDKKLEQKSLSLRVHATHLLRERLRDPGQSTDQTTLASILMLAQLDMCSGDCIEFETHLKAAAALIRNGRNDQAANRYYFEQRLAWLDMMSSTTSACLPILTVQELKTALGRFSVLGKRSWSYDVFPCPIDLCEMILDITVLHKTQPPGTESGYQGLEQADNIMSFLRRWRFSPTCTSPREHMVEVWRLGTIAYLKRFFPSVDGSADAAILTSQALHHAEHVPPASSWGYSLLWPIFQIGVVLGNEASAEESWIRTRLTLALEAVGCRHFSNALETLESIWDSRGQHEYSTCTSERRIMLA